MRRDTRRGITLIELLVVVAVLGVLLALSVAGGSGSSGRGAGEHLREQPQADGPGRA